MSGGQDVDLRDDWRREFAVEREVAARIQQRKWDARHLRLARFWAEECSKDPTTKVGAVVVGTDRRNVAMGYNGFPPGVQDLPERWNDRPTKYAFTQHAERNVLDNAHFDLKGATLATTMFPCVECAKSMVSKGIARLVSWPPPQPITEPSWRDTIPHALTILQEGGVEIVIMEVAGDGSFLRRPL